MAAPTVEAAVHDPLLTYQFRVQLLDPPADATPEELSVSRGTLGSGGSARTPDIGSAGTVGVAATETWEGGNSLHRYANPHRALWEPIALEQGIALDTRLRDWAEAGLAFLRTGRVDPAQPVKRNVLLDVWDPGVSSTGGRPALRFVVFNAWVSKYQAVPRLDAMADEVALLTVELTHHGWRRDDPPDLRDPFGTPD